jgi:hypothetical protein
MPTVLLAACLSCLPIEGGRALILPTITSRPRVLAVTAVVTAMAIMVTVAGMDIRQSALLAVYLPSLWHEGVRALKLPRSTNPPRGIPGVPVTAVVIRNGERWMMSRITVVVSQSSAAAPSRWLPTR